jgi:fatty-acyl-CoA synthase
MNHRVPPFGCSMVGMPLSFVAACMDMVQAHLYSGSTVVFHEYFDAELSLESMQRWHPNFVWMTTPMFDDVAALKRERPFDTPGLTTVHHGASVLPEALMTWLYDLVGDRLVEGYGMTEYSGGLITATTYRDYHVDDNVLPERLRTVGRSLAGSEIALVDESGHFLPATGQAEGELWVRGPALSPGYWARDEAVGDADGWFHSGDVARRDGDGFFYLRGRIRDTIQSGGATVHASEVESCMRELPGVADVAAFGVAHARWGESVAVAIVLASDSTLDEQAVLAFGAQRLTGFKKPRSVFFVGQLPRNRSGKVQKDQLRAQVTA